jgi:exonuclease III
VNVHICLYNIRSIVNKLSNFQSFVYTSDFNVFCISESWLSSSIYDHEVLHSDYVLYRNDRLSRGGGVFIAVHSSIPSSPVCTPTDCEIVSIRLLSSNLILCTVYIPPNCSESYLLSVIQYLSELVCSYTKCIILGDFNFPDICWSSLTCTSSLSNLFCDFIFDNNLTQHVMVPTHILDNSYT